MSFYVICLEIWHRCMVVPDIKMLQATGRQLCQIVHRSGTMSWIHSILKKLKSSKNWIQTETNEIHFLMDPEYVREVLIGDRVKTGISMK